MKCPKCGTDDVGLVQIQKGSRITGVNRFCINMNCSFEKDYRIRKQVRQW